MVIPPTEDNVTLLHIFQLTCTTNDINVQHMVPCIQMHMPLLARPFSITTSSYYTNALFLIKVPYK